MIVLLAAPAETQHAHAPAHDSASPSTVAPSIRAAMARMASGTAWAPDAARSTASHRELGPWRLMLDGRATLQYVRTTGIRAQWQLGSANWLMLMAARDLFGGSIELRTMLSTEPATLTRLGYPLLTQVAQPYRGGTLTDRQHPHELFSELAVRYARPIGDRVGIEAYAALAGEPAIGPVAYRHRSSAANDVTAPLGHHAQDVTHTSFGVLTAGVFTSRMKLEGSLFNGRHPDERRTSLELAGLRLDSWSGRITANPSAAMSVSASYARFGSDADAAHPASHGVARRVSLSVMHVGSSAGGRTVATSAIYGVNLRDDDRPALPAILLETNIDLGRTAVFARAERVRRTAEELALTGSVPPELTVGALSLGVAREVRRFGALSLGIAARGTMNLLPGELSPFYGSTHPLGFFASFDLRPAQR